MYRKYTRAAIRATPATVPITMPTMAPAERSEELSGVCLSVVERKEKNEWRWHYFTVGGALGNNSTWNSLYLFLQGINFLWKVAVRWVTIYILEIFFLSDCISRLVTTFLNSNLAFLHSYVWSLWKCKTDWWWLFLYVITSRLFMVTSLPGYQVWLPWIFTC